MDNLKTQYSLLSGADAPGSAERRSAETTGSPGAGYPKTAPCSTRPDGQCNGPQGGCNFDGCWKKPPAPASDEAPRVGPESDDNNDPARDTPFRNGPDGRQPVGSSSQVDADRLQPLIPRNAWMAGGALGVFVLVVLMIFAATGGTAGGAAGLPACKDLPTWNADAPCRGKRR